MRRVRVGVVVAGIALGMSAMPSAAQSGKQGPGPGEVESDPIRCWWKTDRTAVRAGERFTLMLTCGVIETTSVTVVPTTTQLDPGAIQLTPFEVVGGTRARDIVAPPWRYFQYDYTVRLLGEGFFGQDVNIPALTVTYNIRAASGGGAEGRDQRYLLPQLPMRIESLVPRDAADIRDAASDTFQEIETRRFRATSATVAAGIFFAFALVLVGLAGARLLGRARDRRPVVARPLSPAVVLHGCVQALKQVTSEIQREGWSPERARHALTAFRVAAAVALDRPIAQTAVNGRTLQRDGQIVVRHGLLRPKRAMVSAPVTASALDRHLRNGDERSAATRASLVPIRTALEVLSTAAYGRNGDLDVIALSTALDDGATAVRRLRLRGLANVVRRTAPQADIAVARV